LYGDWYQVKYNGNANAMLCGLEGNGTSFGSTAVAGAGCNNNWSTWGIGSRTQWDVTKTFYLGVEVLYENLHSATFNSAGTIAAGSPLLIGGASNPTAAATLGSNQNNWLVSVRAHRDFLP
jgi:hypothetical protein